jgi:1A family penicillin-binding protein
MDETDLPSPPAPPEDQGRTLKARLLARLEALAGRMRPLLHRARPLADRARSVAVGVWRHQRPVVFGAAALTVAVAAFAALVWARCGWAGCPNVDRLRAYQPGKASRVLDRTGRVFAELRPVEGATVPLRLIPRHVRDAFLAIEDQRFYSHGGVDWRRVAGAALANLKRGGIEQGFSTVTMQLARNLFPDRIRARERTLARKVLEVRVAGEIEDRFEKDEILELYLSHIYFGNGARGIEAAARHYFGTSASKLTPGQAALLAGLIRGPSVYDPRRYPDRARERRDLVLRLMEEQERLPAATATAARAAPLGVVRRRATATAASRAPYFVEEVRRQVEDRLGERIYDETMSITTTLDASLQQAAEEELARQLRAVESGALGRFTGPKYSAAVDPTTESGTPYLQGAVVSLEVGTGDVLAWIGGRDFSQSRFDRVKSSQRQTGSAFKPFVYAAALREGHFLSERISDEPIQVRLDRNRTWEPQNYDREYEGIVTMRDALVRSKNIPTVRLALEVGLGDVAKLAHQAGIRSEIDETPAMPLGTVAVSPLELATAYGAFAGLGQVTPPRLVLRIAAEDGTVLWRADDPRPDQALDPGLAYLITHVLQEAVQRGTGTAVRSSGFSGPAAGKTGTTNNATDTWFVGFTPRMVAAVWMGFDEPRPIMGLATGGRLAAPVWGRTMARAAIARAPTAAWAAPSSVVQAWVDPESGLPLAEGCRPYWGEAYREMFLRSSMPRLVCPDRGEVTLADSYPAPSDEEYPRDFEIWPEDERWGSRPPPPPEYEEAEAWRRARKEQERRARRAREQAEERRRDWEEEVGKRRQEAEEAWREARKEQERRLKDWEKEQKRRRKEREERRKERERGRNRRD